MDGLFGEGSSFCLASDALDERQTVGLTVTGDVIPAGSHSEGRVSPKGDCDGLSRVEIPGCAYEVCLGIEEPPQSPVWE